MSAVDEFTMNINVSNGVKTYVFKVHPRDTIQSIKQKISEQTKVQFSNILLTLNGAFLENAATVNEYDIDEEDILEFEIKLCGPKPADFDWSQLGKPAAPKKVLGSHRVKKVTEL